jgi:hypothetical protein
MGDTYIWEKRNLFKRVKPILSSKRLLRKDYYPKGSVEKRISGREPQGGWRQNELIDGKPPVVKFLWLTVEVSLLVQLWAAAMRSF